MSMTDATELHNEQASWSCWPPAAFGWDYSTNPCWEVHGARCRLSPPPRFAARCLNASFECVSLQQRTPAQKEKEVRSHDSRWQWCRRFVEYRHVTRRLLPVSPSGGCARAISLFGIAQLENRVLQPPQKYVTSLNALVLGVGDRSRVTLGSTWFDLGRSGWVVKVLLPDTNRLFHG